MWGGTGRCYLALAYCAEQALQFHLFCYEWQDSILFAAESYAIVCMCCIFFTCSSDAGQLGWFLVLAIMNSVVINTVFRSLVQWFLSCLRDMHLDVGLLDHMTALCLVYKGTVMQFSIVTLLVYIPLTILCVLARHKQLIHLFTLGLWIKYTVIYDIIHL